MLFDIHLYLKRGGLSTCLGRFNSHVPVERMLVQTDLRIEGCMIGEYFDECSAAKNEFEWSITTWDETNLKI